MFVISRCRIVQVSCNCNAKSQWCQHVVALCLHRIHRPKTVGIRMLYLSNVSVSTTSSFTIYNFLLYSVLCFSWIYLSVSGYNFLLDLVVVLGSQGLKLCACWLSIACIHFILVYLVAHSRRIERLKFQMTVQVCFQVKYRVTLSESVSELSSGQCRKLIQHFMCMLPHQVCSSLFVVCMRIRLHVMV